MSGFKDKKKKKKLTRTKQSLDILKTKYSGFILFGISAERRNESQGKQ